MKRILIEIGHPAHVHQFKNMFWELGKMGWKGLFVTKDKECAIDLLIAYNLPHVVLGVTQKGIAAKLLSLPFYAYKMLTVAMSFKPDVYVSRVSPLSGWISFILRKPHITFTDTENVRLLDLISEPFASVILTSSAYLRNHGKRQIRYPGYHELAYLHPKRFTPDPEVLKQIGLQVGEPFAIIRFVSWSAHHDIGQSGLSIDNKLRLLQGIRENIKVFISSETQISTDFEDSVLRVSPEKMHDLLHFASFFVGEGATMAEESAVLGTPAIYINSITGGVIQDLERFGLLLHFSNSEHDQEKAVDKAIEFSMISELKSSFNVKKEILLKSRIDVSSFMIWFVQEYSQYGNVIINKDFSFERFM